MKKIDLKCENCGALMQVSEDKTEAVCPYCNHKFLIEREPDIEELSQKAEKLSYAKEAGKIKAIDESMKQHSKRKFKALIITIVVFLILIIVGALIKYNSLEYIKDPFECITVNFTGTDGTGTAKIVTNNKCENHDNIKYLLSKKDKLTESEKITITASSDKYRFGISKKEYIVTGLSLYLTDLNNLTTDMITKIHELSANELKENSIAFSGEVVNMVPYKLYLYTNNQNDNVLYDVYKVSIKTKSGNVYEKFKVAYYEDFVLLKNSELFSYSRLYYLGNVINAGDPNAYNSMDKNYAGNLIGFESITDFKSYVSKNNDGSFELKER